MKIVSACFLGIRCLYNNRSRPNKKVLALLNDEVLIPVCSEQLGGLPTPREPSHIVGNKVITKSGKDVTEYFRKGAEEVLKIAKLFNIQEAILKQGSPSCGCGICGPFLKGDGVTTSLLKKNGIKVISQGQIKENKKKKK